MDSAIVAASGTQVVVPGGNVASLLQYLAGRYFLTWVMITRAYIFLVFDFQFFNGKKAEIV